MRRVQDAGASLAHAYTLGEITQRGALSSIRDAVEHQTGKAFSVKTINLVKYEEMTALSRQQLEAGISLSCSLHHPFVLESCLALVDDSVAHVVCEKLLASDICFEIAARTMNGFVYSEAVASYYMRQLFEALDYLHSQGIVHRDIRPHNILLANPDNSAPLKLCGFDVAVKLSSPQARTNAGAAGVVHFMSPEMAAGFDYGIQTDMWSAGVLLHLLLTGKLPFDGPSDEVVEAVKAAKLAGPSAWPPQLGEDGRHLATQLLSPSPSARLSASDALSHPWISRREIAPRLHLQSTVARINKYNERRKLKSAIMACTASSAWHSSTSSPSSSADLPLSSSEGDCLGLPSRNQMNGAEFILRSVDQMSTLCDSPPLGDSIGTAAESAFSDQRLHSLLLLYDKISCLNASCACPGVEATAMSREVRASLQALLTPSAEASELDTLLVSAHLAAALQAHDVIIHEVLSTKSDDDGTATASSSTANHHPPAQQAQLPSRPFSYLNGAVLPGTANEGGGAVAADPGPSSASDLLLTDDDDLVDSVSRVRLVQFQKDTEEPMGITLKVTEDGRCYVARIMHGGMIHRQATLHVGDEIREINGASVTNKSVESLQRLLRDAHGQVTFKIVPSYRSAPPACEIFVRAQFDYEPKEDDLIPCPQAGVPFKTGDILQVISKDDHNWWQARFVSAFPSFGAHAHTGPVVAGLIPSPELQEWRTACLAMERAKDNSHCMWFNKKKKYYTTKYLQKHSSLFDQLDLVTYEEVMRLSQFRRKTLVLLGAHGVGRRHIKNTLIHRHPTRFAYPIPHTTRPPRKDEIDGKHYFFVSNDQMLADIQNNEYLEYGTHEESMYGTKLETIRNIHRAGKIAILDVEPQALKVLRTAEYSPFVIFIAAPNLQGLQDPDGSLERLLRESEVLRQAFGHLFDFVLVNNDIDETIAQIEGIAEKLHTSAQWLPVSWVY